MTEDKDEKKLIDITTELLFDRGGLLWIGLVLPLLAVLVHTVVFYGEGCCNPGAWGQFGDFFGGTLNPILSYFSLIALALTLREQRKLAVESAKKEVLQEMQRVLAGACNALDEYLAVPIDEGDEQDEHLRTNVRDMCANLVQSASTMGDSGHFGPAVPNHLRKNPVIGRSALQFQRVTSICGAYLKEGGTVKVVRLYMSAYMNEAGMFHALFEAPIQLRYFDEYGLHPFRLRAETLAKKFAEADASYKELQASEKDLNEALERRNKWVPDAGESH